MSDSESSTAAFRLHRQTAVRLELSSPQLIQNGQLFCGNTDQPLLDEELAFAGPRFIFQSGNGFNTGPPLFTASNSLGMDSVVSHGIPYSNAPMENENVVQVYLQSSHVSGDLDDTRDHRYPIINYEPHELPSLSYHSLGFSPFPSYQPYDRLLITAVNPNQQSAPSDYQHNFSENALSARPQLIPQETTYRHEEQQQAMTTHIRSNYPTNSPNLHGLESTPYSGTSPVPQNSPHLRRGRHNSPLNMPEPFSRSALPTSGAESIQRTSVVNTRRSRPTLHRGSVLIDYATSESQHSHNNRDTQLNSEQASNTLTVGQGLNTTSRRRRRDNDHGYILDERPPPRRRQPFPTQELRDDTADTRRMGACVRCNRQCIRCVKNPDDPRGPCLPCVNSQTRIVSLPCCRLKITAASLFREGATDSFMWTTRLEGAEMPGIPGSGREVKKLYLTQDRGEATLIVSVRKYHPQGRDVQSYNWSTPSGHNTVECPPYAISETAQLTQMLTEYMDMDQNLLKYMGDVEGTHAIIRDILNQALYHGNNSTDPEEKALLCDTVKFWIMSRFIERPWRIFGTETLGMRAEIDPYLQQARVPVTPVMDSQLDQIVIRYILKPFGERIQRRLQKISKKMKRKSWFGVFLCSALLLSNYELATAHDIKFAQRFGLPGYSNPELVERYRVGAETLLYHYHYTCNGSIPFSLDWETPNEVTAAAELDAESLRFMVNLTKSIRGQAPYFQALEAPCRLEDSMYLVSQLFNSDWKPEDFIQSVVE